MAAGSLTAHRGAAPRHGARIPTIKTAVIAATAYVIAIIFLLPYAEMLITALRPQRELLQGVIHDLNQMLAHFIRAQLTLAALTFVAYSIFLGAMRVPYALVLGTIGGLMEFVQLVGPLTAAVTVVGVALLLSYPHWLVLVIFGLLAGFKFAYLAGLVFILGCLVLEHWLARRRRLDWIQQAFFRLNAVISIVFLVVTLTEIVFPWMRIKR